MLNVARARPNDPNSVRFRSLTKDEDSEKIVATVSAEVEQYWQYLYSYSSMWNRLGLYLQSNFDKIKLWQSSVAIFNQALDLRAN